MKKLLLIALMVSGLAFNGEARVQVPDSCRQTAQDTLTSCRNAAQSDYSLALAKCDNLADPAARAQCQSQASTDLNDAQQTCQEQNDVRIAACDRLGGAPGVFLQPSIKLLDAFLKPGFTASRIPLLQIARSDEVSPPDPHDWNAIFLNNSAEMARLIARLKSRAGNIEQLCLEACGN